MDFSIFWLYGDGMICRLCEKGILMTLLLSLELIISLPIHGLFGFSQIIEIALSTVVFCMALILFQLNGEIKGPQILVA